MWERLKDKISVVLVAVSATIVSGGLTFLLTACKTLQDSYDLVANAAQVDDIIMTGKASSVIHKIDYSDEEKQAFATALLSYQLFRNKWSSFLDKDTVMASALDISFSEFEPDFNDLLKEYQIVRDLVASKWSEYPPSDQTVLRGYGKLAIAYRDDVQKMIAIGDENEAVFAALEFGRNLTQVILR